MEKREDLLIVLIRCRMITIKQKHDIVYSIQTTVDGEIMNLILNSLLGWEFPKISCFKLANV